MYYFAYGGNTNSNHMKKKYPSSKYYGVGICKKKRLVFRKSPYSFTECSYCDI